jgi:hypothetical protein
MQPFMYHVMTSVLMASAGWLTVPAAWAGESGSQEAMEGLVAAALDQRIDDEIEISERPILEALGALEAATGLRFAVDERAIKWMPYGEHTKIEMELEDISVREGLGRIFDGLGLRMRVRGGEVLVEPAPWLERLGRRMTIDEVKVLGRLAKRPYKDVEKSIDLRFDLAPADTLVSAETGTRRSPKAMLEAAMPSVGFGNALWQLEGATQQLGWRWVPDGRWILVYNPQKDAQRRLERRVDLRFENEPLGYVLRELAQMAGLRVVYAPGVQDALEVETRAVTLVQSDITVVNALELLATSADIGYDIRGQALHVSNSSGAVAGASAAAPRRPSIVAILRVPVGDDGTTIDFLIREDEVPPEFGELKKRKLPEVVEVLRKRLGTEGVGD